MTKCEGTVLVSHNPGRGNLGENNYASGGPSTLTKAVVSWAAEGKDYDDATGCAPGKVCGHYTQVMWKSTTQVGCGVAICDNLQYSYNLVCDYSPPGNSGKLAY